MRCRVILIQKLDEAYQNVLAGKVKFRYAVNIMKDKNNIEIGRNNISNHRNTLTRFRPTVMARRQFLAAGLALTAVLSLRRNTAFAQGRGATGTTRPPTQIGRRKLGSLEVSSVGLGVQNMSRTYQTTIPTRSEMFNIIRTAFDRAWCHLLRCGGGLRPA